MATATDTTEDRSIYAYTVPRRRNIRGTYMSYCYRNGKRYSRGDMDCGSDLKAAKHMMAVITQVEHMRRVKLGLQTDYRING